MSPRKPKAAKPEEAMAPKAPAKRAPRAKKQAAAKSPGGVQLSIDYPQAGETVRPGHYSIRISATLPVALVEVSVDGGTWTPCRQDAGYWWYDWTNFETGEHRLRARVPASDGIKEARAERECQVNAVAEQATEE